MLRRIVVPVLAGMVASACGTNTDLTVDPSIALSSVDVVISAPLGTTPPAGTVRIINGTDGTLEGLTTEIEFDGAASGWLAASLSGTSATQEQAATLTLQASLGSLTLGTYQARVRVLASGAVNSGQTIRVQLIVRPRPPAKLQIVTQPPGTATNGTPLSQVPVVQLLNALDEPALEEGVVVTASVTGSGGGTLSGTSSAVTDANGRATFPDLTIIGQVGSKNLVFSAGSLPPVTSSSITLSAGAATTLEAISTLNQTVDAGTAVPEPPRVRVVDQSGNPVSGFNVSFTASAGSTIAPTGPIATTSAGLAALSSWTLRALAGTNTVVASATGLAGSPITFTGTGRIGAAASLVKESGDNLIGLVGTTLATPHVVRVIDAAGNGVQGISVAWAVTGGGSVAPTTGTTDANGLASATRTLGPNPGSGTTTATATIGGTPRTVTFSVTAALAGPAQIVKVEGDNQSAQAGATLPVALRVQVLDALSAPVPNVTVTFTTPNGGSFPSGASVQTDGNGFASATWQLGNTAGAQTAQAAVGGPAPAVFSATALAGPISASQSSIAANPTTITAGGAGTTVTVTARDASGNPVSGATVVLSVTGTTGLIQPAGPTNANGQATGSYSSTVAGPKTVSATVGGTAVSQTATVTVQAAAAASIAAVTPLNFSVRFNQAVSTVPRVKVTDQFNNPVAGVAVTFAVTKGVSSLTGTNPATTGANGEATLGAWTITAVNPIFNTDTRVENRLRASATGLTGNPITFIGTVNPVSFGSDLMPIFNSCNSCHSHSFDAGGNATNTRTSLLNSAGYVVPGDSTKANNFILSYPQSGGHSGGNPGSDLMTIIAAWIKQGATQNQPPTYPRP